MGNRASMLAALGELDEARALTLETRRSARSTGRLPFRALVPRASTSSSTSTRGDWDRRRRSRTAFIAEVERAAALLSPVCHEHPRAHPARRAASRRRASLDDSSSRAAIARRVRDPQVLHVTPRERRVHEHGARPGAPRPAELLDELLGRWGDSRPASPSTILACSLGRDGRSGARTRSARCSRASTARRPGWPPRRTSRAGELREAAEVCASMPSLPDEAYARLRAAEQLVAEAAAPRPTSSSSRRSRSTARSARRATSARARRCSPRVEPSRAAAAELDRVPAAALPVGDPAVEHGPRVDARGGEHAGGDRRARAALADGHDRLRRRPRSPRRPAASRYGMWRLPGM